MPWILRSLHNRYNRSLLRRDTVMDADADTKVTRLWNKTRPALNRSASDLNHDLLFVGFAVSRYETSGSNEIAAYSHNHSDVSHQSRDSEDTSPNALDLLSISQLITRVIQRRKANELRWLPIPLAYVALLRMRSLAKSETEMFPFINSMRTNPSPCEIHGKKAPRRFLLHVWLRGSPLALR